MMFFPYKDKEIPIIITYKNNKNMYLRIRDFKIYITAPKIIKEKDIKRFIESNKKFIINALDELYTKKILNDSYFYYLGNKYFINYIDDNTIYFEDDNVYIGKSFDIDKWYRKKASLIFPNYLNDVLTYFQEGTTQKLKIRKMKSRWGVCNIKTKEITLNLELIKYDPKYLRYVIIHELAHLKIANHSKDFWEIVEKYEKNYKIYKKQMKNLI